VQQHRSDRATARLDPGQSACGERLERRAILAAASHRAVDRDPQRPLGLRQTHEPALERGVASDDRHAADAHQHRPRGRNARRDQQRPTRSPHSRAQISEHRASSDRAMSPRALVHRQRGEQRRSIGRGSAPRQRRAASALEVPKTC
jgi:hypothetical protein